MLLDQGDHVYLFLLVKIGVFFRFVLFSYWTKLKGQVKQSSRRTNCFKKRSIWSLFVFAVTSNFFTNTCWLPKNGQVEKFSTISNVHIAKSVFAKCVNVEVDDFIKTCLFVFVYLTTSALPDTKENIQRYTLALLIDFCAISSS